MRVAAALRAIPLAPVLWRVDAGTAQGADVVVMARPLRRARRTGRRHAGPARATCPLGVAVDGAAGRGVEQLPVGAPPLGRERGARVLPPVAPAGRVCAGRWPRRRQRTGGRRRRRRRRRRASRRARGERRRAGCAQQPRQSLCPPRAAAVAPRRQRASCCRVRELYCLPGRNQVKSCCCSAPELPERAVLASRYLLLAEDPCGVFSVERA